jgi:hypothetical protein
VATYSLTFTTPVGVLSNKIVLFATADADATGSRIWTMSTGRKPICGANRFTPDRTTNFVAADAFTNGW